MPYAGIVERDGLIGLYRGFVPNALKNLPNSRYPSVHDCGKIFVLIMAIQRAVDMFTNTLKCSVLTALLYPCSIKLTAFDTVKTLISTGQKELEKLIQENQEKETYSS